MAILQRHKPLRVVLAACVLVALIAVAGVAQGRGEHAGATKHAARTARSAASKAYAATLTYQETNPGSQHGSSTVGIHGHGAFQAKLGAAGAAAAAVLALATGVPVAKIARGGVYKVERQIAPSGVITGIAVATFKAHGLGSVCLSYVETPGMYVPGSPFVPMSGAIKTLGGSGQAATWRANVSFKQTSVSGSSVESFGAGGSEQAGTGKPRLMNAACKRVAGLKR